jgi:hypothetical protein
MIEWLRLVLSREPNTVGVSHSSEDGNRSSFRNVVFSSFYNTGLWTKSKNPAILSVRNKRLSKKSGPSLWLSRLFIFLVSFRTLSFSADFTDFLSLALFCLEFSILWRILERCTFYCLKPLALWHFASRSWYPEMSISYNFCAWHLFI